MIVDSKDSENNEYVELPCSTAIMLTSILQQFNDSVEAIPYTDDWNDAKNLCRFDVFIISSFSEYEISLIQNVVNWMFSKGKLVLDTRTFGQLGYLSCHKRTHIVIDSHSPSSINPLFIVDAFPELKQFYERTWDRYLKSQKNIKIPYPVYLYHYYQEWKERNMNLDTKLTQKQKQDFKKFMESLTCSIDEEYIKEYVMPYIHHTWTDSEKIHNNLQILADHLDIDKCKESNDSLILYTWISMIKDKLKIPFCTGTIPDMECDTEIFVEFTQIMKSKYEELVKEYSKKVHQCIPLISLDYIELQIGLYFSHLGELVLLYGEELQLMNDTKTLILDDFYKSIYFSLKEQNNARNLENLNHLVVVDSMIGAIAAQEVIKYCTGHYIPLSGNQVLVYQSIDHKREPFNVITIDTIK